MKQLEVLGTKLKRKIKSSIAIKTFLTIFLLLTVCCIIIYGFVMYSLPELYQSELESQFTSDFQQLTDKMEKSSFDETSDEIIEFALRNNAVVYIQDSNNKEIFSINNYVETDKPANNRFLTLSSSLEIENTTYYVEATANFVAVSQTFSVLIQLIPFTVFAVLVVSTIGAIIFSKSYSKPLINISEISKKMASLDMTWKCDTRRTDEIGILSKNLNTMSEQLYINIQELQNANVKLQEDIIKERNLEKQRTDFFTAVSHELKTPITIMKGELEGMIYNVGDYKNRDKYIRHVLKTASSMEKLVQEILSASKMDSDTFKLNKENVNISLLTQKIIRELQGLAEDRFITIEYNLEEKVIQSADCQLLKKAISNIISNAIFHSPEYAEIHILLNSDMLTVSNSGTYIETEELEHIFMPFYRIDKSHNSNTGGSGLGLYIVKTILEKHKYSYSIENSSSGVTFKILFNN